MKDRIIYRQKNKDELFETWHASTNTLIIFVYSDEGSIVCSKKIYPIKRGTLVLISANEYHYTMQQYPEKYERSKLIFLPDEMDKICNIFDKDSVFFNLNSNSIIYAQIDDKEFNDVDDIFRTINNADQHSKYFESILYSNCLKLFIYLDKYCVESNSVSRNFIYKAIQYINQNIKSKITIDDLCSTIGISKYYFCTQFKKKIGKTVMEYILETRIVLSKNMLEKGSRSITEICEECGFSSQSYFSQVFHKATGFTPSNYRKKFQK